MKRTIPILITIGALCQQVMAGAPFTGILEITENDTDNAPQSVTLKVVGSPGVSPIPGRSNKGDFALNFPWADDLAGGSLISCVAVPTFGGKFGVVSSALIETDRFFYFAAHSAGEGNQTELNIDVSYGYFPFDQWLGATTTNTGGTPAILAGSPGIAMDTQVVAEADGTYTINLSGPDPEATSQNGILLVSPVANNSRYALSTSKPDGSFAVIHHIADNTGNGAAWVQDPITFVYIPASAAGTDGLVASGRILGDGTQEAAGGTFTTSRGDIDGEWFLEIPGHNPSTGTLLLTSAGRTGQNSIDNIVAHSWDGTKWRITSRDLGDAGVGGPQLLVDDDGVFNFAFFAHQPVNIEIDSSAGTIAVDGIDQAGSFRGSLPYTATTSGGLTTFKFAGDFVLEATDHVRCVGSNAISMVTTGDIRVPEGAILDASARFEVSGETYLPVAGPGGGLGGGGGAGRAGGAGGQGGNSSPGKAGGGGGPGGVSGDQNGKRGTDGPQAIGGADAPDLPANGHGVQGGHGTLGYNLTAGRGIGSFSFNGGFRGQGGFPGFLIGRGGDGGMHSGVGGQNGSNGSSGGSGGDGFDGTPGSAGRLGGFATNPGTGIAITGGAGGGGGSGGGAGGGGGAGSGGNGGGGGGGEAKPLTGSGNPGAAGGRGRNGGAGGRGGSGSRGGTGGAGGGAFELIAYGRIEAHGLFLALGGEGAPGLRRPDSPTNGSGPEGGDRSGGDAAGGGGDGGSGGRGGTGGNGAAGGIGGSGGSGAGGTVKFHAPSIDSTGALVSTGGGLAGGAGRLIFSEASVADFAGTNLAASLEAFDGLSAANPHLADRPETPYLPALRGGSEVAGVLNGLNAADLQTVAPRGDSRWMAAYRVSASTLEGYTSEYEGFDYLFLVNLTRDSLPEPVLGAGNQTYYHRLIDGGLASNPRFGGSGYVELATLGDSEVYVTLVPKPEAAADLPVCFGFRRGASMEIAAVSLADGEAAYLELAVEPNYGTAGDEFAEATVAPDPVITLPDPGLILEEALTGGLTVVITDPEGNGVPGALWSLQGDGRFFGSDVPAMGLPLGSRTVQFEALRGWLPPRDQIVQILPTANNTFNAVYTPAPQYELTTDVNGTPVGAIAPQSTRAGETLGFWIGTNTEQGFAIDDTASLSFPGGAPDGLIALVAGWFSYEPAPTDREPFTVEITSGGSTQEITINPQPELAGEERVINLRFNRPDAPLPDASDEEFHAATTQPVDNEFDRLVIGGAEIVLDDFISLDENDPVDRLSTVSVYAEKVRVVGQVDLLGAGLTIYARELSFEGDVAQIANCGEVELNILDLDSPSTLTPRFTLSPGASLASPFSTERLRALVLLDGGTVDQLSVTEEDPLPIGYRWLHPVALRHLIDYVDKLYYLGFYQEARGHLIDYLGWIRGIEALGYDREEITTPVFEVDPQTGLETDVQAENGNGELIFDTSVTLTPNGNVPDLPDAGGGQLPGEAEMFENATLYAFGQIAMDLDSLLGRLDDNLDYFGNPLGWTPMLSFETIYGLAQGEIRRSMDALYLAYWLGNKVDTLEKTNAALVLARNTLGDENTRLRDRFSDLQTERTRIQADAAELASRIASLNDDIVTVEERLLKRAEEIVNDRNDIPAWKQGLRAVGTISQMVPVYQPALAAAGAGLDLITRLDEQDPLTSVLTAANIAAEYQSASYEKKANEMLEAITPPLEGDELEIANLNQTAGRIRSVASGVNTAVEKVQDFLQNSEVPAGEIGAELQRLRAGDPQLAELALNLELANQDKAFFAEQLSAVESELNGIPGTIQGNLLAMRSFKEAEAANTAVLNPGAISHLRGMERRAEARLREYFYWLAKSYEYRFLDSYGNATLDEETPPTDLFTTFKRLRALGDADVMDGGDTLPDQTNGAEYQMNDAQFNSLKAVFESELGSLSNSILRRIVADGSVENTAEINIVLSPAQIADLNANNRTFLNLVAENHLDKDWEQIRISDLRLQDVQYSVPGGEPAWSPTAGLEFVILHGTKRIDRKPQPVRVQRDGEIYLFNPRNETQEARRWTSTRNLAVTDPANPDYITETIRSVAGDSLLNTLIPAASDPAPIRPAAWADLKIELSKPGTGGVPIVLEAATLRVSIDYYLKNETTSSQVEVRFLDESITNVATGRLEHRQAPPLSPRVWIDQRDENGRQDGVGPIVRRYKLGPTVPDTSFTAEETFGQWEFVEWRRLNDNDAWETFLDGGWTTTPAAGAPRPRTASVCHSLQVGCENAHYRLFAVYRDTGDRDPATVESIELDVVNENLGYSEFVVTFSESVVGVDDEDFEAIGGTVSSVTGTGTTRRVRVNGTSLAGFKLADDDSILDFGGNSLAGPGEENGDFDATFDPSASSYTISIVGFDGGGAPRITVTGPDDGQAMVQWSPDLEQWNDLQPVTLQAGQAEITDPSASSIHRRFYRVSLP